MKLLCICPIGIGNYLMFYPSCALIKKMRPDIELHILALRKAIKEIASGDHLWDKVHLIDPTREKNKGRILSFIKELRKESYDVSLSFFPSNTWQYNLLPFLCGIPKRYNFSYPLKKISSLSFLSNRKYDMDHSLHDVNQNAGLAGFFLEKDLGKEELSFPLLYKDEDTEQALNMLKDCSTVRLAIHPGSSVEHGMDAKRWEPERFGLLADRICESVGATALIFGGPDEQEIKLRTKAVMKHASRIIEPVNLGLTAALIKQCSLCLCNDSGLMHVAAGVGIPVVAIFGPTDEKRNGPFGSGHLIIRKKMPGFPLWTARNVGARVLPRGVDPRESLNALSVDEAWEQLKRWLEQLKNT